MISDASWRTLVLIAILMVPSLAQEPAAQSDLFAPLSFFVGTWSGEQNGQPGRGTAERTYVFVLDNRFRQEKNKNGEVHQHMSMIGYDKARKRFFFRQFHVERLSEKRSPR